MTNIYNSGDIVLGNWKLIRLIGEGSYGRVFEAEREDFGRIYKAAIKIITIPKSEDEIINVRSEGMDDKSVTAYFRSFVEEVVSEFALMSKLKGTANIVSYEDHTVIQHPDKFGWDIIIRMELLTPLLKYATEQSLTKKNVIKLGIDICRALELCQKFNIVHRDIKPENIFISELDDFKLGDFGIARTIEKTMSGLSKKGTYFYMAPEVVRDDRYNSTVDIYSLGIVLYRLLNHNRFPFLPDHPETFTYSDREAALNKRLGGVKLPNPKNADGRLAEIVLKACAYDPKDRYSSPMQMRQELEAIQYSQGETPLIYPKGDEVPVNSIENVSEDAPAIHTFVFEVNKAEPKSVENPVDSVGDNPETPESPPDDRPKRKFPLIAVFGSIMLTAIVFVIVFINFRNNLSNMSDEADNADATMTVVDLDEPPTEPTITFPTESIPTTLELTTELEPTTEFTPTTETTATPESTKPTSPPEPTTKSAPPPEPTTKATPPPEPTIEPTSPPTQPQNTPPERYQIEFAGEKIWSDAKELSMDDKKISDITPLKSLVNLTELFLADNQISDITPLKSLTNLTKLSLWINQISDIMPLQSLTNLTELSLQNNQIRDITSLQSLTNLTGLSLDGNQISDITPLQSLTNLTYLYLGRYYVVSIWGNQISDITSLQTLTNLTELSLDGNQISDITPLKSLTNLTYLTLSYNQISDITSLQTLTNLTTLFLESNQISDITPLKSLTNLTYLTLSYNPLNQAQIDDLQKALPKCEISWWAN